MIVSLVGLGFSLADIENMTLGQLTLFSEAGGKQRKLEMREAIVASLAGARYSEENLAKLMKELEK